tara:strand:+ start:1003 stop:1884 length:882 start_codon:yes stop_codon:yes gene_type:complete
MSKIHFITDFIKKQEDFGGAAMTGEVYLDFIRSLYGDRLHIYTHKDRPPQPNEEDLFIFGNRSLYPETYLNSFIGSKYIIFEHDHQYDKGKPGTDGRNPWIHNMEGLVPDEYKQQLDFYKNAKVVFVLTDFHKSMFEGNKVECNLENIKCSLFSRQDLDLIRSINKDSSPSSRKICVHNSNVWLKGTSQAIDFCKGNKLEYELLPESSSREEFLRNLSKYSTLVFFPLSPESCCRFVMEAKMLGLNVLTSQNYGASTSEWFTQSGNDLIDTVENLNYNYALPLIEKYLKQYAG